MFQVGGTLVSSGPERSSLALCEETTPGVEEAEVNLHRFRGRVAVRGGGSGSSMPLQGLNRPRGPEEMVLYRAPFAGRTRTEGEGGIELVLDADGRVVRVATADTEVPANGAVLSAAPGAAAVWLRDNAAAVGSVLTVDVAFAAETPGCKAVDVIGAGPRLVRAGRVDVTEEGFAHQKVRHPRTAFAITGEGRWLFITLDGRQPASNGMTLVELAGELVSMGVREAINLDGGGSTVMIAGGRVRNNPSDGRERPVSDAILIFSTPDAAALENLLDALAQDSRQVDPPLSVELRARLRAGDMAGFAELVRRAGTRLSAAATRLLGEAAVAAGGGAQR
jgi:hypothetical protein